jgi:pyruvate,orthophosphate dikinase
MARRPASRKKAKASPARKPAPAKRKAASKPAKKPARVASKAAAKSAAKLGQWVYTFGGGRAQGRSGMKELLGGKGANLAEMANLGLPVPPGFTITTAVCTHYYANDNKYPRDLEKQVEAGLAHIAKITGRKFGDAKNPLLVSVRSGARASMPGMMDTVLNLGLNDNTVRALAEQSGDRRFAFDSYRRFIQIYSNVVLDIEHHKF